MRIRNPRDVQAVACHEAMQLYVRGRITVCLYDLFWLKNRGKGFFLKGARIKGTGGTGQLSLYDLFARSLNGQCPAGGLTKGDPRVSRSSHDTHVERWIARASEMASVYARERRPVPHSESVRTRFHISHNRLVAERGTVERSFLAAPISLRPFWYPMWSLISPVCSGLILVARLEIELIFWYNLAIRSIFRGGYCSVGSCDLLNIKAEFPMGMNYGKFRNTICSDIIIKSHLYFFNSLSIKLIIWLF